MSTTASTVTAASIIATAANGLLEGGIYAVEKMLWELSQMETPLTEDEVKGVLRICPRIETAFIYSVDGEGRYYLSKDRTRIIRRVMG
jgi:hypothetical protein